MNMKLLVCGGAGFIGSAFIRNHLHNNPNDVITNLDNLTLGSNLDNLKEVERFPNYSFVKGDIKNFETISTLVSQVDVVVNFAAETHVDRSISNPRPFVETNVFGTYTLLEAIRKLDKLYVNISTDEVYGDAENGKSFTENDVLVPSNPYSATKASADNLVAAYHRTYGIKCITTRCTNNFGPYQFPEKLIPKTIIRALKGMKIPLYGGGRQIRSWIYVLDHVEAIDLVIKNGKSGEIYNISASNEILARTIVEKVLEFMNRPIELMEDVGDRPGQDKRYSLDSSKIEKTIGWKPRHSFDKALQDTIKWYLDNQKIWEPLANERTLHSQPWTLNW